MGDRRGIYRVLVEREHFKDLSVNGRIVLKWMQN
jgi:hypothetical protein